MEDLCFGYRSSAPQLSGPGTIPAAIFLHPPYVENRPPTMRAARPAAPHRIAVPAPGKTHCFDDVLNLVSLSILYQQQIAVLCLSDEIFHRWSLTLQKLPQLAPALDIFDVRHPRGLDWVAFFEGTSYDITILHDVSVALRTGAVSVADAKRFVAAVPAGLVMFA